MQYGRAQWSERPTLQRALAPCVVPGCPAKVEASRSIQESWRVRAPLRQAAGSQLLSYLECSCPPWLAGVAC